MQIYNKRHIFVFKLFDNHIENRILGQFPYTIIIYLFQSHRLNNVKVKYIVKYLIEMFRYVSLLKNIYVYISYNN